MAGSVGAPCALLHDAIKLHQSIATFVRWSFWVAVSLGNRIPPVRAQLVMSATCPVNAENPDLGSRDHNSARGVFGFSEV